MRYADGQILLVFGLAVLLLTVLTETAWRRSWLPYWLSRKLLHMEAVGVCAVAPMYLKDLQVLTWIVAGVEILLLYLVARGQLFRAPDGQRSWGIVWFPMAYLGLLLLATERFLIVVPMAILAFSDALAAMVGQLFARRYFRLTGDRKSLLGSFTFWITALLVVWTSRFVFPELWAPVLDPVGVSMNNPWIWAKIGFAVAVLTALEALGSRGLDNLLIPLGAALLLERCFAPATLEMGATLWIAMGGAVLFAWFTIRRKSLALDGAVMAAVLGLWILYFSDLRWLWPLFFFFGSSTLLGRLNKRRAAVSDAKHGQPRDYRQVLCNGGIYALLAIFAFEDNTSIYTAMAVSVAISTADTWASEIGMYYRGRTYDLWRWQPTPVGLSGGVSWAGTLGGLAGAVLMASAGFYFLYRGNEPDIKRFLLISGAGFLGMLLDSLLGATLQARYRQEETGAFTDIPTNILDSGYAWMSNDLVNLLSNALVVLAVWYGLLFWHF